MKHQLIITIMTLQREVLEKLIHIGIALSSEKNIDKLLENIVDQAMELTGADGGSIYVKEDNSLSFKILKNKVLKKKFKGKDLKSIFPIHKIPINYHSIAGYAALKGEILNFKSREEARASGFSFDEKIEKALQYVTQSTLTIPLKTRNEEVVGVLQLINPREDGKIVTFKAEHESVMKYLASQAAIAIQNAHLIKEIKEVQLHAIYTLSSAAEFRDKITGDHIKRISQTSYLIARKLGLDEDESELILYASPMHDIGKIAIPDRILFKPARLTENEWRVMQKHTIYGAQIIGETPYPLFQYAKNIALYHHERFDGKGYPEGLKGKKIPLEARIVAIADVFDALVTSRPYKKAWSIESAIEYIAEERGHHFDPEIANIFLGNIKLVKEIYRKIT